MKNKIKFLGIVTLVAIIGFSMITCNLFDDNTTDPKAVVKPGLYAKEWSITENDTPIVSVPANNIKAAFDYVNDNPGTAANPIKYTLLIDQDVNSGSVFLGAQTVNAEYPIAHITIMGIDSQRTIQYNGSNDGGLFAIGDPIQGATGHLILGNNITLKGIQTGERPLVGVDFGTLIMEAGSKITGHKTSSTGSTVSVYDIFVMNGGEISGNESQLTFGIGPGAVFVSFGATSGNFIMNGGTITGNTGSFCSGGVYVDADIWSGEGTFTMNGGTISGNTSMGEIPQPSDVWVSNGANFTQTGGTIAFLQNDNN